MTLPAQSYTKGEQLLDAWENGYAAGCAAGPAWALYAAAWALVSFWAAVAAALWARLDVWVVAGFAAASAILAAVVAVYTLVTAHWLRSFLGRRS